MGSRGPLRWLASASTLPFMGDRRRWLTDELKRVGLAQRDLAKAVGVTEQTVARWVSGKQNIYRRNIRGIADALAWTPQQVIEAEERRHAVPRVSRVAPWNMDRPEEADASSDDAEARLRGDVARLVDLDGRFGGDDVLPIAARLFRSAKSEHLSGRGRLAAVAELGEVAGWVAYDAARLDLARSLSLDALHLAELAGDLSMVRFLLANVTMVDLVQRRPVEALTIVDYMADQVTSPRIAALFELRRAHALAQMSERYRALRSFDHARVLLDDGIRDDDPRWSWWIDAAELSWHKGTLDAELGDWARAVDTYREATESRVAIRAANGVVGRSRVVYNDLAHYAEALATVGAWSDLEPVMKELTGYVDTIGSARTRSVIRRVLGRIREPSRVPSTLGDLADLLGDKITDIESAGSTPANSPASARRTGNACRRLTGSEAGRLDAEVSAVLLDGDGVEQVEGLGGAGVSEA